MCLNSHIVPKWKPTGFHQIFVVKRWDVHTWNVWSGSPAEPSDDSWWPQSSPSPPRSPSPSHQAWGDREQTQAQSADAHLHVWTTDQKLEVQKTLKRCNTSINQNHFLIWGCYYTGSGTLYKLVLLLVETTVSDKRAAVTTQLGRLNGLAAIK